MKTFVKKSNIHGKGVFAKEHIKKNVIFLIDNVLVYDDNKVNDCIKTYTFPWMSKFKKSSIALGHSSFLNSSKEPNSKIFKIDKKELTMSIISLKSIKKNEEITINYKG